jgi:ribosomal protein S10
MGTKLHGIAAVIGPEKSGKTTFLKQQISVPFFKDYYVIVIGKKEEWEGAMYDQFIDMKEFDEKTMKQLLKTKNTIIVIDDADIYYKFFGGETKFWSKIKKISKKNQIIFAAQKLPDYKIDYELIVFVYGIGSDIVVLRHGVKTKYSWDSMKADAIFMIAVLE